MDVSIVVPIRNEIDSIREGIDSILDQDYPSDQLEVLLVDGGSTDGTRDVLREIAEERPNRHIKILDNPHVFAPHGLNIGIGASSGDVVIIVGGHSKLDRRYVSLCIESLQTTGADCVGGVLETQGSSRVAKAISRALSSKFGVGGVAFRTGRKEGAFVDTVAFGAYRRNVFSRIGVFDTELVRNQDDEFNFRLTQSGGKIWLEPRIRAIYYSRSSFKKLWRQYYQYGLYKVRVIQKRNAVPSIRHLVPATFVCVLGISVAGALVANIMAPLLLVCSAYAFGNMAASVYTSWDRPGLVPFVSFAYVILHLSYGIGFLAGFWRWRKGWRPGMKEQPTVC